MDLNFHAHFVWIALCLFTKYSFSLSHEMYRTFYFDDICKGDNSKLEIDLKSGAAIFRFDEANLRTRRLLSETEISCHVEVETVAGHGFHAYIDEMNLDYTSTGPTQDSSQSALCQDYLQFGRDVWMVTTFMSQHFCGTRTRIQYGRNVSGPDHNSQLAASLRQGNRLYIEEKDKEMDIWLKVRKSDTNKRRNLTLVVTTFKKACDNNDAHYRHCPRSNHCVRKEYFCDGAANCAWPSGDTATDETSCDSFYSSALDQTSSSTGSDLLLPSNIPVVIIIVLGILTAITVFGFVFRRLFGHFIAKPASQPVPDDCYPDNDVNERTPSLAIETGNASSRQLEVGLPMPSAPPPPYEEAIKDQPPPYSEASAPPINPNSTRV